jgi:HD-GYP domain-containing protein (c-di-GMP phosphodiesterase class II)
MSATSPVPTDPMTPANSAIAKEVQALLDDDPTEAWPALHRRLTFALQNPLQITEFHTRLAWVENGLQHTLQARPDDSLFVLVQMLSNSHHGYSATHALLCAVTCQIIAPLAGIEGAELQALTRAALTMNIGISRLQDNLAHQIQPVDNAQRDEIQHHPNTSAELLRKLGVEDELWLTLVQDHHESPDGKGYPNGKTTLTPTQQLLRMADLFTARISPRKSRRGLAPNLAVGNIYIEAQEASSQLGAIFVKQLGMYPPGTYVRLKSEETAVVVRRGQRVNTPVAMAIADGQGMPLSVPSKRDTQLPPYNVQSPVAPEEVKIRVDTSRLLKRI